MNEIENPEREEIKARLSSIDSFIQDVIEQRKATSDQKLKRSLYTKLTNARALRAATQKELAEHPAKYAESAVVDELYDGLRKMQEQYLRERADLGQHAAKYALESWISDAARLAKYEAQFEFVDDVVAKLIDRGQDGSRNLNQLLAAIDATLHDTHRSAMYSIDSGSTNPFSDAAMKALAVERLKLTDGGRSEYLGAIQFVFQWARGAIENGLIVFGR